MAATSQTATVKQSSAPAGAAAAPAGGAAPRRLQELDLSQPLRRQREPELQLARQRWILREPRLEALLDAREHLILHDVVQLDLQVLPGQGHRRGRGGRIHRLRAQRDHALGGALAARRPRGRAACAGRRRYGVVDGNYRPSYDEVSLF